MNAAQRDQLLLEMNGRLKVVEAAVVGAGDAPGVVKRVTALEQFRDRCTGALALLGMFAAMVVKQLWEGRHA